MKTRLIIEGNTVYEIDEECMECRRQKKGKKEQSGERKPDCSSDANASLPDSCSGILR